MVKGISKQVILVQPQDKKLFDQAIFILSDEAVTGNAITEDMLLKEAKRYIKKDEYRSGHNLWVYGLSGAFVGAIATGLVWLLCSFL